VIDRRDQSVILMQDLWLVTVSGHRSCI